MIGETRMEENEFMPETKGFQKQGPAPEGNRGSFVPTKSDFGQKSGAVPRGNENAFAMGGARQRTGKQRLNGRSRD